MQNSNLLPIDGSPVIQKLGKQVSPSCGTALEMKPLSDQKGKRPRQDTLTFEGRQVTSTNLFREGYPTSSYSVTVQTESGMVIWETMQTGPNGEVVCWRGEYDGQRMRGVVTRQKDGKELESFSFIAVSPVSQT